jgi:hypothetical protein
LAFDGEAKVGHSAVNVTGIDTTLTNPPEAVPSAEYYSIDLGDLCHETENSDIRDDERHVETSGVLSRPVR